MEDRGEAKDQRGGRRGWTREARQASGQFVRRPSTPSSLDYAPSSPDSRRRGRTVYFRRTLRIGELRQRMAATGKSEGERGAEEGTSQLVGWLGQMASACE